jgi:hypothetical protein
MTLFMIWTEKIFVEDESDANLLVNEETIETEEVVEVAEILTVEAAAATSTAAEEIGMGEACIEGAIPLVVKLNTGSLLKT